MLPNHGTFYAPQANALPVAPYDEPPKALQQPTQLDIDAFVTLLAEISRRLLLETTSNVAA